MIFLVLLIPFIILIVVLSIPAWGILGAQKVARRISTPTTRGLEKKLDALAPFPDTLPVEVQALYEEASPILEDSKDPILHARYRDQLRSEITRRSYAPIILQTINTTIQNALDELKIREIAPTPFTVPLYDRLKNTGQTVAQVIKHFQTEEVQQLRLFSRLREQLNRNIYEASGIKAPAPHDKLIHPYEYEGSAREIVKAYLGFTPLQYLFDKQVPFPFTDEQRFEHMHVIAGTGWGKTQLLQHIILHDVAMRPDSPGLVVIDSQGDMLQKIQRMQVFKDSLGRLIIIDPAFNPALNIFDMSGAERLKHYSPLVREQIEAGIFELYNYIFGAIASEMTSKQGTAFVFVVRLMLSIEGATLHTLLELMEDGSKAAKESHFYPSIEKLDPTARTFFENQFFNRQAFGQTKQQLARRLYSILSVPAFNRAFAAEKNKLDMFEALQSGKVVLVNTSKALLKTDASALFGRYMIALTMAAAFERAVIPEKDRRPSFLIIDEAADYFDESLESLLTQARKYKLGVLFAHQHMQQLTPQLRSSVASNTTIKFAGGVSDQDARTLDADMRTTNDFITSMRKKAKSTEFAAYIRNVTPTAVRLEIPFGTLESQPRMTAEDHKALIERNIERYSGQPAKRKVREKISLPTDEDIAPSADY